MSIQIIYDDILNSPQDIIIQQVNCQGVMGAGLGLQLRKAYPDMYHSYISYCEDYLDPSQLLGKIHYHFVEEEDILVKTIINIFGQLYYGRGKTHTDYSALHSGLSQAALHARRMKKTTAIPWGMGAGLAGGDWNKILPIIERYYVHEFTRFFKRVE